MTTATPVTAPRTPTLPDPRGWHRPLLLLTLLMAALTAVTAVLAVASPVEITGRNGWLKPLKFSVSIGVYTATLALLLGALRGRARRIADRAATVAVVGLVLEIVIITGAVAVGTTSHFNVSTPLHSALWGVMAVSIVAVWLMTLVVGVLLLRTPGLDRTRALAVRAGVVLALVGMAVAFFMTSPTAEQLDDFQGIAGAHAVGAADDDPGLPLVGWSTTGGDLRVPHFLGIHAMQALPLLAFGLEWLSRRVPVLRDGSTRTRLVAVGSAVFAGVLAITTLQALAGEPVTAPSGPVLATAVGLAVATGVATVAVLLAGRRRGAQVAETNTQNG